MSKPSPTPARETRRPRETGAREFELFDDLMPVRRYKLLLQTFLKRRGSGSRQAIAEALGNTRSFVTQITSPAYDLAIPAQHVLRIVELARLEPDERRMFLDAYIEAHPERGPEILGPSLSEGGRSIVIEVPALSSETAQRHLEQAIRRVADEIAATFVAMDGGTHGDDNGPERAA
jgi:hypothetical protein